MMTSSTKTAEWKCPNCGQRKYSPKAFVCPMCLVKFDTNYNMIKESSIFRDEHKSPAWSLAMDDAPEYVKDESL